jgi:undecaprenyl-diphosphatase
MDLRINSLINERIGYFVFGSFNFDQYLLSLLTHHLRGLYWFFYAVTMLGSPTAITILASIAFILGKNKLKIFAAVLIIGLLFSFSIVDDTKDIIKRPRPPISNDAPYRITGSYSFPSGHALTIFLAAAVLGAYFGWKYRLIGYVLACLVSISRVYLGVHYPTDIIAGAIIGTLLGELLVYSAYRYGLCDNAGLLSLMRKPAAIPGTVKALPAYEIKTPFLLSAIAFISVILALALYQYGESAPAIFILSAASMFLILYTIVSGMAYNKKFLAAFIFIAAGIIGALALDTLQAYMLSLVVVAIAYIACLALSYSKEKTVTKEPAK